MKQWLLLPFFFVCFLAHGQDTTARASQVSTSRAWIVGGLTGTAYAGSFIILNKAWYNDYPRSSFHTFNDNGEWLQMDKIGHAWTAYHTSRFTSNFWQWAGMSKNNAVLLGSGSSLLYMLSIEYLDGRSSQWGWSWGDVGADVFGASLFAGQEWGWKEQRIGLKLSALPKHYAEPDLEARADDLFGRSFQERLLKDYNAQIYWLSANLKSFFKNSSLPSWLNVSLGYGAGGMYGGFENIARDKEGNVTFDRRDISRYRQWYLAPDVDLTKIKTKSKFLHSVFSALNVLKFPAPAIELSRGKLRFKAIAY